jgi:hypothetical protein
MRVATFLATVAFVLAAPAAPAATEGFSVVSNGVRFEKPSVGGPLRVTVTKSHERGTDLMPPILTAGGKTLYLRTFDSNMKGFVWDNFDKIDPSTGTVTTLVEGNFFFDVGISVDNIGAFDRATDSFLYATDVVFGKCTEASMPLNSAILGPTNTPGRQYNLQLSGVNSMVSAGKASGVFIGGDIDIKGKSEFALRKLMPAGKDTSQIVYDLPPTVHGGALAYDEGSSQLFLVSPVLGTNNTNVDVLSMTGGIKPKLVDSTSFDCASQGIFGYPTSVSTLENGKELIVLLESNVNGKLLNTVTSVNVSTKKCEELATLTGIVTAATFDSTVDTLYLAEAAKGQIFLHNLDVKTKKMTSVKSSVAIIDLEIGN